MKLTDKFDKRGVFPTQEQIWKVVEEANLTQLGERRVINEIFRKLDQSNLYPINGRFNATERAIRKARQFERSSGAVGGLEYIYLLDQMISEIVNGEA